jgi:S1-C subfamily serine protease
MSPEGYLIMSYILTNNHVVEGADAIEVVLPTTRAPGQGDRHRPRERPGGAEDHAGQAAAIVLGNSDALQVGDQVLAIGNPFGVGQTVTSGIVSALGRNQLGINTFENFIQTDAAINPGNSGGALTDIATATCMGINTAIYSIAIGTLYHVASHVSPLGRPGLGFAAGPRLRRRHPH